MGVAQLALRLVRHVLLRELRDADHLRAHLLRLELVLPLALRVLRDQADRRVAERAQRVRQLAGLCSAAPAFAFIRFVVSTTEIAPRRRAATGSPRRAARGACTARAPRAPPARAELRRPAAADDAAADEAAAFAMRWWAGDGAGDGGRRLLLLLARLRRGGPLRRRALCLLLRRLGRRATTPRGRQLLRALRWHGTRGAVLARSRSRLRLVGGIVNSRGERDVVGVGRPYTSRWRGRSKRRAGAAGPSQAVVLVVSLVSWALQSGARG